MNHIVLLGDSIFDNDRYVPGGPSVIEHVQRNLPRLWRATLLAIDGSVASDVANQLGRLPEDATHLVVSAGGNNALDHSILILQEKAQSYEEVLTELGTIRGDFQREYRDMLQTVLSLRKPTVVCTIYDSIPAIGPAERAGLCLFNDVILREAFRANVPVIDLRVICNEPTDYAPSSPIEPSVIGGGKVARAVIRAVMESDFAAPRSHIIT